MHVSSTRRQWRFGRAIRPGGVRNRTLLALLLTALNVSSSAITLPCVRAYLRPNTRPDVNRRNSRRCSGRSNSCDCGGSLSSR